MSRGGCYGITNADWLISPPAAQILPGLLRERVRMAKIKETERVRIPSLPAFFFVSRVMRDASACEKHLPPVISGESGRRPPPRRFAPRGRTSPYSPEMTGGTYIYSMIHAQEGTRGLLQNLFKQEECSSSAGDGLDETHTNDKVVTEKDASRRPQAALFHPECFAQLQGGDVPILYEAWLQETK